MEIIEVYQPERIAINVSDTQCLDEERCDNQQSIMEEMREFNLLAIFNGEWIRTL